MLFHLAFDLEICSGMGLMLVVLHTAVCYSPHVSEQILVCFSNVATNIVESPTGIWGKGAETMASS